MRAESCQSALLACPRRTTYLHSLHAEMLQLGDERACWPPRYATRRRRLRWHGPLHVDLRRGSAVFLLPAPWRCRWRKGKGNDYRAILPWFHLPISRDGHLPSSIWGDWPPARHARCVWPSACSMRSSALCRPVTAALVLISPCPCGFPCRRSGWHLTSALLRGWHLWRRYRGTDSHITWTGALGLGQLPIHFAISCPSALAD